MQSWQSYLELLKSYAAWAYKAHAKEYKVVSELILQTIDGKEDKYGYGQA